MFEQGGSESSLLWVKVREYINFCSKTGEHYLKDKQYDLAKEKFFKAKNLLEKVADATTQESVEWKTLKIVVYRNLTQYYSRTGNLDKGLHLLKKVLPLQRELEHKEIILPGAEILYISMSDLSYKLKLPGETLTYCGYAIKLLSKQLNLKDGLILDFDSQAWSHRQEEANVSLVRARKFIALGYAQHLYARALVILGKKHDAVLYLEQAVKITHHFLGPNDKVTASYAKKLQALKESISSSSKKATRPTIATQQNSKEPMKSPKPKFFSSIQSRDDFNAKIREFYMEDPFNSKQHSRGRTEVPSQLESQTALPTKTNDTLCSLPYEPSHSKKHSAIQTHLNSISRMSSSETKSVAHRRNISSIVGGTSTSSMTPKRLLHEDLSFKTKKPTKLGEPSDTTIENNELLIFDFSSPSASNFSGATRAGAHKHHQHRRKISTGLTTTSLALSRNPSPHTNIPSKRQSRPISPTRTFSGTTSPINFLSRAVSPTRMNKRTNELQQTSFRRPSQSSQTVDLQSTSINKINITNGASRETSPAAFVQSQESLQNPDTTGDNRLPKPAAKIKSSSNSQRQLSSLLFLSARPPTASSINLMASKAQTPQNNQTYANVKSPSRPQTPAKQTVAQEETSHVVQHQSQTLQFKPLRPQTAKSLNKDSKITPLKFSLRLPLEKVHLAARSESKTAEPHRKFQLLVARRPEPNPRPISPQKLTSPEPKTAQQLLNDSSSNEDLEEVLSSQRSELKVKKKIANVPSLKFENSNIKSKKHALSVGLTNYLKSTFPKDHDAATPNKRRPTHDDPARSRNGTTHKNHDTTTQEPKIADRASLLFDKTEQAATSSIANLVHESRFSNQAFHSRSRVRRGERAERLHTKLQKQGNSLCNCYSKEY